MFLLKLSSCLWRQLWQLIGSSEGRPDRSLILHRSPGYVCRLVLILEAQGDVQWEVPPGAHEAVPLFQTTSAYLHKKSLTFLGGNQGWSVTFSVRLSLLMATHAHVYANVQVKGELDKGWMVLESEEEGVELLLSLAKVCSSLLHWVMLCLCV